MHKVPAGCEHWCNSWSTEPQFELCSRTSKSLSLGGVLAAIISHSDRQLLGNKLSFTLCSIHILFNSNKFHKFWMSCDFRWTCTKVRRKWTKTQADRPLLGRPAWHPYTSCHIINPEAMWHEYNAFEPWIEYRFDRRDRKALAWIKGPQVSSNSSAN